MFEIAQLIFHLGLFASNHWVKNSIWASDPSTTSPAEPYAENTSAFNVLIPSTSLELWASIYVSQTPTISSGPATTSDFSPSWL